MQKGKMVVGGGLKNSYEKRSESKGEKERYTHRYANLVNSTSNIELNKKLKARVHD